MTFIVLKSMQEAFRAVSKILKQPDLLGFLMPITKAFDAGSAEEIEKNVRELLFNRSELQPFFPETMKMLTPPPVAEKPQVPAKERVLIHTDGACSGNPGPGGWAVIIGDNSGFWGCNPKTTNNIMELRAMNKALEYCAEVPGTYLIRSDSEYVLKGIREWMQNWKARGWRTADNKPVKNEEFWRDTDRLYHAAMKASKVTLEHVRGHAGDVGNELADKNAVAARLRVAETGQPSCGEGLLVSAS